MTGQMETNSGGRPRDLRLDFFRGLAMFIILVSHTPENRWAIWIPARFGFSDATEIFVFCSGMASALAFGGVFIARGWFMGAARVAYRVWQVYWAHISVFFATALTMALIDRSGLTPADRVYTEWWPVSGLFLDPEAALVGLFTLSYTPPLFDILPMYLAILAMIPAIMLASRLGGRGAVLALVAAVWLAAQLALWGQSLKGAPTHALGEALAALGDGVSFLILPANPWQTLGWYFNPFGWQLVFFTGFAFGMKWLPAPPVRRGLVLLAIAYLLLSLPFAWFKIYANDFYLPPDWAVRLWVAGARDFLDPLIGKSGVGLLRYLHFLALAYLAWVAVGPGGVRLNTGWRAPGPVRGRAVLAALALLVVVTIPYAYAEEIRAVAPTSYIRMQATLIRLGLFVAPEQIGLLQIAHGLALAALVWSAIGAGWRGRVTRDWFLAAAPVIRKVGTQSLAVFMVSITGSQVAGWALDMIGRNSFTVALVNLSGFAVLIGTAYLVGWFKSQPWRRRDPHPGAPPA
ncbi:MAG: OpgC family protein [Pikeienuella sp.]